MLALLIDSAPHGLKPILRGYWLRLRCLFRLRQASRTARAVDATAQRNEPRNRETSTIFRVHLFWCRIFAPSKPLNLVEDAVL